MQDAYRIGRGRATETERPLLGFPGYLLCQDDVLQDGWRVAVDGCGISAVRSVVEKVARVLGRRANEDHFRGRAHARHAFDRILQDDAPLMVADLVRLVHDQDVDAKLVGQDVGQKVKAFLRKHENELRATGEGSIIFLRQRQGRHIDLARLLQKGFQAVFDLANEGSRRREIDRDPRVAYKQGVA